MKYGVVKVRTDQLPSASNVVKGRVKESSSPFGHTYMQPFFKIILFLSFVQCIVYFENTNALKTMVALARTKRRLFETQI